MDHKYVDDFDLVERYSTGRLTAEEAAEFEEHFVDCLLCVDRLETMKSFLGGLRLVAGGWAPPQDINHPSRVSRSLAHATGSRRFLALAAGVLLFVTLAGVVLIYNQIRRSSAELEQARNASTQWETRFDEQRESSSVAETKLKESERALTEQVTQLRTELENERKQRLTERQSAGSSVPQINLPILVLSTARGSEPSSAANEIPLPNPPGGFAISLSLEGELFKTYRMTILSSNRQVIWKRPGLKPDHNDALSASFPATLFRPGNYLLKLEGVTGDGKIMAMGEYTFRLLRNH